MTPEARSDASHATTSATRPGCMAPSTAFGAASWSMRVFTAAGLTDTTRTPCGRTSAASASAKVTTAPFVAA